VASNIYLHECHEKESMSNTKMSLKPCASFSDLYRNGMLYPNHTTDDDSDFKMQDTGKPLHQKSREYVRLTNRNLFASLKLLHKHHITHIASQSVLSSVERFPGGLVVLEELCGKKCKFFWTWTAAAQSRLPAPSRSD
jgi:hypothetical protein